MYLLILLYVVGSWANDEDFHLGDLPMQNPDLFEGDILGIESIEDRNAIANKNLRWPEGIIYYKIDPALRLNTAWLNQIMRNFEKNTCLKFVERTTEPDYVYLFIYNTRTGKKIKVTRLVRMHADEMEDINEAYSGDICALFGVDCASGDTFVTKKEIKLSMESIHIPEPVISMSVKPKENKKMDVFSKAIGRFTREDPTYRVQYDPDIKETIASGMGELHLEIYAQRMEREYNCEVVLGKPRVAFRESLLKPVEFDYLHKKQHGGSGQFARVIGILEPLPAEENTKIIFSDETVGTNIPKPLVPGVEKGFRSFCEKGMLTGHKIAGVKFRLIDGEHHIVDSNELSFMLAAQGAVKQAYEYGCWHILEPIMLVEVTVPQEYHGTIISQLNKRNGIITAADASGSWAIVRAEVPLNAMFGYATDLRSNTQGKGEFTMEYSRYSPASLDIQQNLISQYEQERMELISKKKN